MEHAEHIVTHDRGFSSMSVVLFIGFLVILWAVWTVSHRSGDYHTAAVRAMDQVGYQAGYMQKQANDIQYTLNNLANRSESQFEYALANGFPARTGSQSIGCRGYGYGAGVVNGSTVSESRNFANEGVVFG